MGERGVSLGVSSPVFLRLPLRPPSILPAFHCPPVSPSAAGGPLRWAAFGLSVSVSPSVSPCPLWACYTFPSCACCSLWLCLSPRPQPHPRSPLFPSFSPGSSRSLLSVSLCSGTPPPPLSPCHLFVPLIPELQWSPEPLRLPLLLLVPPPRKAGGRWQPVRGPTG